MDYPISRHTILPFIRLYISMANGLSNIPADKPFIVASNQISGADAALIVASLFPITKKKVHFMANLMPSADKKGKLLYNLFLFFLRHSFYVKWSGSIVIDPENKEKIIEDAANVLRQGAIVGVFPEGRRSVDGKLMQGRTGIARILLKAKMPVIPIGLIGTDKILPRGCILPKFIRAKINIGRPMDFKKYFKARITKKLLRNITDKIMHRIAELTNQKYMH